LLTIFACPPSMIMVEASDQRKRRRSMIFRWKLPVGLVRKKRMVKKQQMRWTPPGAHLLLQVRTRVLNNDLANDFHRWYPRLHPHHDNGHTG